MDDTGNREVIEGQDHSATDLTPEEQGELDMSEGAQDHEPADQARGDHKTPDLAESPGRSPGTHGRRARWKR